MSTTATLSAAAADRKARLAQLKSLKRKAPADEVPDETGSSNTSNAVAQETAPSSASPRPAKSPRISAPSEPPAPIFDDEGNEVLEELPEPSTTHLSGRNYDPLTRGPKLGFETAPTSKTSTLEKRAEALSSEVKAQLASEDAARAANGETGGGEQLDLFKLRPKKPNWDLKRRLEERMRGLDVRTENAIARLVRERIEGEKKKKGESNMVEGKRIGDEEEGLELGMEGNTLVEATKEREREAEEDARRDREAEAELETT